MSEESTGTPTDGRAESDGSTADTDRSTADSDDDAPANESDGDVPATDADGSEAALTHTDEAGSVQMVDVGEKPDSRRRAVAAGRIRLQPSTIAAIEADELEKGDVLSTARIGAVQAVKHTWETIPMCHQIPITNVDCTFTVGEATIDLRVAVETTGKTGCEMEALEGVTTGLNVVWDMCKAAEKTADGQYPDTAIETVRVVEKRKRRDESA